MLKCSELWKILFKDTSYKWEQDFFFVRHVRLSSKDPFMALCGVSWSFAGLRLREPLRATQDTMPCNFKLRCTRPCSILDCLLDCFQLSNQFMKWRCFLI